MKKNDTRFWFMITILALGTLFLAACSGSPSEQQTSIDSDTAQSEDAMMDDKEGDDHDDEELSEDEHEEGEHIQADLPSEFEGLENPFGDDAVAIAAGAEIYAGICAKCHGETGDGDGPIATGLDPKPTSLADGEMMADLSDAYVFWRITKGSAMEPFNSQMPTFEFFSEEQRWELVSFVRSLSQ